MSQMGRVGRIVGALLTLVAGCAGQVEQPPADQAVAGRTESRPNVVVIVVDDLRWDEFGAAGHPWLETPNIDRLAAEGALFTQAFHAVSLCSPNRASILTGQYPSRHGIIDNVSRALASHRLVTFPQALQRVGYRTAFLGKWHMGNEPTPRPGFDYWVAFPGQGRSIDPEFFEDGRLHLVPGYTTDLLTDRAVGFIERERGGPFMLYLAHKAIHPDVTQLNDGSIDPATPERYVPAPRHQGRYQDRAVERRGNVVATLGELDEQPVIRKALAELVAGADTGDLSRAPVPVFGDDAVRRRAEMLLAVDESLGRILAALEARGILDQTAVILTSDNGFFFGEHGLTTERRLPYEESIRNPLMIRYPPVVATGSRPAALVSSVDIAPTVLDLAGAPIGPQIQGRSLVPLLRGDTTGWRQAVLVEFTSYENPFPHLVDVDYRAVRTDRYKYIRWLKFPDKDELYDLAEDPLEQHNLASVAAMARVKADLRAELGRLVLEAMGLGAGN
ncbi:MAG: betC 2 [Gemmatimonadetes bacterium]|nr:betC 2 [Gemmatimonadota bacterium]